MFREQCQHLVRRSFIPMPLIASVWFLTLSSAVLLTVICPLSIARAEVVPHGKQITHHFILDANTLPIGPTLSPTFAPGELDLSFGFGGSVSTIVGGGGGVWARTILVQPDGKVLICGTIYDYEYGDEMGYFLGRYQPSGKLDTSFGRNGLIALSYYGSYYVGHDVAIQDDGRIVTVGFGYGADGAGLAVHRYNANGTLDRSFGTGGVVISRIGSALITVAEDVEIQADGKIVVVGTNFNEYNFVVVRYNRDGSLDTSFANSGIVITPVGDNAYAKKLIIQPDGKIVVLGHTDEGANDQAFALVRYNQNGSLDSTFGLGGTVIHAYSTEYNNLRDAVLQPDGKIVAVGYVLNNPSIRSYIVRYKSNGSIDLSFANNGIFEAEAGLRIDLGIALQTNGKLLAFGNAIIRLDRNGSLDPRFGTNGRVTPPMVASDGGVQPDGKILAAGSASVDRIEIVRYHGDAGGRETNPDTAYIP